MKYMLSFPNTIYFGFSLKPRSRLCSSNSCIQ